MFYSKDDSSSFSLILRRHVLKCMLKNHKALYGTKNKDNQMQKYTTVFHILDLIQGLVTIWQLELIFLKLSN